MADELVRLWRETSSLSGRMTWMVQNIAVKWSKMQPNTVNSSFISLVSIKTTHKNTVAHELYNINEAQSQVCYD